MRQTVRISPVEASITENDQLVRPTRWITLLGPGLAIAATGVGAGDLVAASVAGSRYGLAVVWAVIVGAALKFGLNEGLARWQLATGTTLLQGWAEHLGSWVRWAFLVYLVIWTFVVGGALISACGLAAHALAPVFSVAVWGVVHSVVAIVLVVLGGYRRFEGVMKWMIGGMFVAIIGCAVWSAEAGTIVQVVRETGVPEGSIFYLLGVMGGVGGSVTLLSYGYWIHEKGWRDARWLGVVRFDLVVAYVITGLFGVSVVVLAAGTLHSSGSEIAGNGAVLHMAAMLGEQLGPAGHWLFRLGFWAAVATSMLGVWQGVPYLFCDFVRSVKGSTDPVDVRSAPYRWFLAWLALPPMVLLAVDRPVAVVIAYSVLGALFMPFLAGTLLVLGSRQTLVGQKLRNGWLSTVVLVACLVMFFTLAVVKISGSF